MHVRVYRRAQSEGIVRRPRTSTDWWFYCLAACIALMTAALVLRWVAS